MKIGILTFQNTVNYGAKFQEYALQKYINDNGMQAEVIDYINQNIEEREKPLELKEQKSIKGIIKYFLLHKYQISKLNKFNEFTNKYVKKSNEKYSKENIAKTNDMYDKFIVGSDQIWNTNTTKDDYTYYLDFVNDNNKKLSYAASFGYSKVPDRNIEAVTKLLQEFKELNAREEEGKDIINSLTKKDANVVVDPTFLLPKNEWEKFANNKKREPYIVAYMVNSKSEVFEYIDNIAKKENLKIVYISDFIKKHNANEVEIIHDASPEEFINLVCNAKYVVTGSFHAICMSIILEKNFFYMLNDNNVNSRLTNLIKMAGLEDRIINSGEYVQKEDIDYKKVAERMNPLIQESKRILNDMIKE
jgi:hypothetical protein